MAAALAVHEALVRLLVERQDVDINAKDQNGSTPLYRAYWLGRAGNTVALGKA